MPVPTDTRNRLLLRAAAVAVGLLALGMAIKIAWVSEDAYIVFRSIEQLFDGNGPRWNPHERVQVFTSPLWYGVLCAARVASSNVFLNAVVVSILCWAITLVVVRRALERIRIPNDFRAFARKTGKQLYMTACDLDTAERTIFGADENAEVTISQAVQASSALPIFYKPARMNGIDYIDGGVRHTANIDIAIEKGADLIICYNPFRPFNNRVYSEIDEERYGRPPVCAS